MTVELGRYGVWDRAARWVGRGSDAAELEELGYGALWLGGSPDGSVLTTASELLDATEKIAVATAAVNVWTTPAGEVNDGYRALAWTDRFLVGIGTGHGEPAGEVRHSPYQKLIHYLDELDVPRDRLALAALGPRLLRLAAARTSVAHPYMVTPDCTARARETVGAGVLLAPGQHVVLESDPSRARDLGREALAEYLARADHTPDWLRDGFTEEDLAGGGSDRLVDALVAWGGVERVAARLREHHEAGADHVAVRVVGASDARRALRDIAAALAD
ncbi:putative F420-dependent oxidoreductase [Saccharothrix saharensis]|uniref:Putative F420-dependent oxidoreductase n=1 Tax=Saccharothrix saharensis TaxID=571190 RepID=A0A543JH24_9PSEU|nr:TIGR03620 family F420-dependent LLM class oxidoreductase [Saccharothrix saharensis]TQM82140.1 putative F420-dependent oxidoreductase [Saccharothrix saharensis]